MKEHYGFTQDEYLKLLAKGVTLKDLFNNISLFCPHNKFIPVSTVSLYYYADFSGNFIDRERKSVTDKIAMALFNKLDIKDKINLAEYIEYLENKGD